MLKHSLRWLVCALAFATSAQAQTTPEPFRFPRIGDVIDPEERRYFGLFPDLNPEDTLRVERSEGDSVQVATLSPGVVPDVRLRFSGAEAVILSDLITRYETLFSLPDSTFEAFRVSELVRWRQPYQEVETWTTLALRSGPDVRGILFYADEEGVVLSSAPFSSQNFHAPEALSWIRSEDVLRVRREGFWSRLDLRPSGDAERYRRETLPTLRGQSTFVRGLPPELEAWRRTQAALKGGETQEHTPHHPAHDYTRLPLSRWRVAVQYGMGRIDAGSTTAQLFGGGGTFTDDWSGGASSVQGRVDYALTPTVGVGVAVGRTESDEILGIGVDGRQFSTTTLEVTASYSVVPPQLLAPLLPSLTVRAGGALAHAVAETRLEYYWPNRDYTALAEFSERRVAAGVAAGVEVAFRISRGASVLFGYDVAVYPWMEEETMKLDDPRVDLVIKTVEPRAFAFRRGGGTVGVSIHFGGP